MIWKILGTIGGATFLLTGISVLSDPKCSTADLGGGRVLTVTCHSDSYGTMSGLSAGILMILIGLALLLFLYLPKYFSNIRNKTYRTKQTYNQVTTNSDLRRALTTVKYCDKCSNEVPVTSSFCINCSGSSFSHKLREVKPTDPTSEEALLAFFPPEVEANELVSAKKCDKCESIIKIEDLLCGKCGGTSFAHTRVKAAQLSVQLEATQLPVMKVCPMCAEDIRYAAKKCRYCGTLLYEEM